MIIDPLAQTFGLPKCLITPIAAKSIEGIVKYIGHVNPINGFDCNALIVTCNNFVESNDFDLWNHPRASLINSKKQLWVDVDFTFYRKAYEIVFNETVLTQGVFIDHIMNRKLARMYDYRYIRLIHVRNTTNTSSGRGAETLAVKGNDRVDEMKIKYKDQIINYADPFDLIKILDIPTGRRPYINVGDMLPVLYDGTKLDVL